MTSGVFASTNNTGVTDRNNPLYAKIQWAINATADSAVTVDNFNHYKVGGERGVAGNSKTMKPEIYKWVLQNWHLQPYGSPFDYTYPPAFIFDESAGDGLGRDTSILDLSGLFGGAAAGTAVGGPWGGAIGGIVGFFSNLFSPKKTTVGDVIDNGNNDPGGNWA